MNFAAPGSEFGDAALLLVGHGSTLNGESSGPTHRQAGRLRQAGIFREVATCFWKEQPVICAALRGLFSPRIFVVPLFISDGYFTEEVIPRELGMRRSSEAGWPRLQLRGEQTLHYCGPAGTHASMATVILNRAAAILADHHGPAGPVTPSECSLFVAGHGTSNNENSRKAIEAQVERIARRGIYQDVHAVFMEEAPRIESAYELAQTRNLVVVPFFMAEGLHSQEDIPVLLGESTERVQARLLKGESPWQNPTWHRDRRVWYGRCIGDEPGLADVILERVRESARA